MALSPASDRVRHRRESRRLGARATFSLSDCRETPELFWLGSGSAYLAYRTTAVFGKELPYEESYCLSKGVVGPAIAGAAAFFLVVEPGRVWRDAGAIGFGERA